MGQVFGPGISHREILKCFYKCSFEFSAGAGEVAAITNALGFRMPTNKQFVWRHALKPFSFPTDGKRGYNDT